MDALENRRLRECPPNHPGKIYKLIILQTILGNLYPPIAA